MSPMEWQGSTPESPWKREQDRGLPLHVEDPDRMVKTFESVAAARAYWEEQGRPGDDSWCAWWRFTEGLPDELRSIDNWVAYHGWDAPTVERWRALYEARREYTQKLGLPARRSRYEHLRGRQ